MNYFLFRAEEEGEDIVDSDFSIDENDEPVSDNEEENQKKRKRLVTKAYKEPAPKQQQKLKPRETRPRMKPSRSRHSEVSLDDRIGTKKALKHCLM